MYRDELSRKDLKFKLKAQSLGISSSTSFTPVDLQLCECFKPVNEWPDADDNLPFSEVLKDGYQLLLYQNGEGGAVFVVRVTGPNPGVEWSPAFGYRFTDCEPIDVTDKLPNYDVLPVTPKRYVAIYWSGGEWCSAGNSSFTFEDPQAPSSKESVENLYWIENSPQEYVLGAAWTSFG